MTESAASKTAPETEHVDVLVVGAGISGVGAAYHLKQQCPDKSYVVLEHYESYGGTWWMHRYPGIRSDSDLYTFGYRFKPWTGHPIATAEEILKYMARSSTRTAFLWMCQGYYRHAEGYTPEWDGHGGLRGRDRPPADLARGPRLRGQARRRDRLGRDGGHPRPRDRRPTSST